MPTRPILVAESPILNQIRNSDLSKLGRTTLTGIFESKPQNSLVRSRDFQVPREDLQGVRVDPNVLTNRTGYLTYLDSLKPYINRVTLNGAAQQAGGATQQGTATTPAGSAGSSGGSNVSTFTSNFLNSQVTNTPRGSRGATG